MILLFDKDGEFFSFVKKIKDKEIELLKNEPNPENKYLFVSDEDSELASLEKLTDVFDF